MLYSTSRQTPYSQWKISMDKDRPSTTANGASFLRAAHQILDEPRIYDDPIALKIIGANGVKALTTNPDQFQTAELRSLRAFIVMRGRYAEDELAMAVKRGVGQYVILGAGLDSFAYRNPYAGTCLKVFEVDHPATQAWKRRRLQEEGIDIPGSLTFAPIDFERQSLSEGLTRAGFRTDEPTFFSWLGVTVYLTKQAVIKTLAFVASTPTGSGIVFSFNSKPFSPKRAKQQGREALADRLAGIGEPYLTYFDPICLKGILLQMGFTRVEYFSPDEANRLYFSGRTDGLRIDDTSRHLMHACV